MDHGAIPNGVRGPEAVVWPHANVHRHLALQRAVAIADQLIYLSREIFAVLWMEPICTRSGLLGLQHVGPPRGLAQRYPALLSVVVSVLKLLLRRHARRAARRMGLTHMQHGVSGVPPAGQQRVVEVLWGVMLPVVARAGSLWKRSLAPHVALALASGSTRSGANGVPLVAMSSARARQ